MGLSPINSHNGGKKEKTNHRSQGLSEGTAELLRNILGPDFNDYEFKDGDSLYFPDNQGEITQEDVAVIAQQSQQMKNDRIGKPGGPIKDFFIRIVLGSPEKIIESNLQ